MSMFDAFSRLGRLEGPKSAKELDAFLDEFNLYIKVLRLCYAVINTRDFRSLLSQFISLMAGNGQELSRIHLILPSRSEAQHGPVYRVTDATQGTCGRRWIRCHLHHATRHRAKGAQGCVPPGTYLRIAPRSGLASKGIAVLGGVVDSNYTGEVSAILFNTGAETVHFSTGRRIAQIIPTKIVHPTPVQVRSLMDTDRGASGFGSSGRGVAILKF
ncbi:dUTPase-domain-containing protein, partial [Martensiomyces pterosporus]